VVLTASVPLATADRVSGNVSVVVPDVPVSLLPVPESVAAKTTGVRAAPAATAPAAPIMPRRENLVFWRWECGVDGVREFDMK
jgi:hypothetical protein